MNDISVINNVKIETDWNGNQHFTPIEQLKPTVVVDNRSWWQKLCDWWNDTPVKPYIKVRNLSDPTSSRVNDIDDRDAVLDGKSVVEFGIKISF